jgi:hypothetical protein
LDAASRNESLRGDFKADQSEGLADA